MEYDSFVDAVWSSDMAASAAVEAGIKLASEVAKKDFDRLALEALAERFMALAMVYQETRKEAWR